MTVYRNFRRLYASLGGHMQLRLHRFMLDANEVALPREKCPRVMVDYDKVLYSEEDLDDGSVGIVFSGDETLFVCESLDELEQAIQTYWNA